LECEIVNLYRPHPVLLP